MGLDPAYILPATARRKIPSRSEEVSLEGIREMIADPEVDGRFKPAARTALRCVEERGADPRLMLLVLEQMQEGYFDPSRCWGNA